MKIMLPGNAVICDFKQLSCPSEKEFRSITENFPIKFEVPQGSVMGPLLYVLYYQLQRTFATFDDGTVILASKENSCKASKSLQTHVNEGETWRQKWNQNTSE